MTESISPLSILSFGAGAIGTYIGGSLVYHGHKVVFLERPDIAVNIKQSGLKLGLPGQEISIADPIIVSDIEEAARLAPFDFALFAMKSYDTASALKIIHPYRDMMPPVLCLQNGVDNEEFIAQELGLDRVIAASVTSAIGRRGTGNIILERLRGIAISQSHPLSARIVKAFNQAGLNSKPMSNAKEMKWSKMLTNLVGNATSAILNMPPLDIFAHPGLFKVEIQQLREALSVMNAFNLRTVNLPGTQVRLLAMTARYLPLKLAQILLKNAVGGGRGGKMPSFHLDLYSGRSQSEVNYLNGAVVKYGNQKSINTSVNRFLTDTLIALTRGELPLHTYDSDPEKLLDAYQKIKPG